MSAFEVSTDENLSGEHVVTIRHLAPHEKIYATFVSATHAMDLSKRLAGCAAEATRLNASRISDIAVRIRQIATEIEAMSYRTDGASLRALANEIELVAKKGT